MYWNMWNRERKSPYAVVDARKIPTEDVMVLIIKKILINSVVVVVKNKSFFYD